MKLSRWIFAACAAGGLAGAQAHVVLPPGGATVGATYHAAFKVGHACSGATATTALKVLLPPGFDVKAVPARPGWQTLVSSTDVTWRADSPQSALPNDKADAFVLQGVPAQTGTLWFKVTQTCDGGVSAQWDQIPAAGAATDNPAVRLDVWPLGRAPVDVQGAWARPTVEGQAAGGAYLKLLAPSGARLVGGRSPAVDAVEIHEMKMDGDVMRMREVREVELPPGQAVELKPGGYHLMLMNPKQALRAGGKLPLTLRFVDREGRESTLDVAVPVAPGAPSGAGQHHH